MAEPSVTEAEFEVLTRRAGLDLTPAQSAALHGAYGHLQAMLARLRGATDRTRGAEPALVFIPGQEWS